jgi:hypothetical protein
LAIVGAWLLVVCGHFLWEAWIIATRGFDALPECYRGWCPHGILNRITLVLRDFLN